MKNKMKYSIVALASLSLTACMTTKNFTPENKQVIHKITVDKNVKMPADIAYMGPGIGYVGLLSAPSSISTGEKIKEQAAKNKIKLESIVRDEFINDIKHDTKLVVVDQAKSDATLEVEVVRYGFIVPQGFSFEVSPNLLLSAKLTRGHTIIWQNHYLVSGSFYTMKTYKPDDLISNPKLIAKAWHEAAQKAVKELTKDLS